MKNISLFVTNENHDILEEYNGNSIRELFLKVSKKHFHLYEMARKFIIDEDKNINDENLGNLLVVYFNSKNLECVIGRPYAPKKIVVYYDEN